MKTKTKTVDVEPKAPEEPKYNKRPYKRAAPHVAEVWVKMASSVASRPNASVELAVGEADLYLTAFLKRFPPKADE